MRRINHPNHARYLTFSTYKCLPLFGTDALRDVFTEQLGSTQCRYDFDLHAWVLMPNHVHLLLRSPKDGRVSELLRSLKAGIARRILGRWRELDAPILPEITDARGQVRFWQRGGGHDRNIVSDREFDEKLGYIHMNPVRAGLVERSIDWRWSSARFWSGDRSSIVKCVPRR